MTEVKKGSDTSWKAIMAFISAGLGGVVVGVAIGTFLVAPALEKRKLARNKDTKKSGSTKTT